MNLPELEKKILKYWQSNRIFEKSLKKTRRGRKFVFYEGPPFANGKPGIHHLLARTFKDIILRYKTMQGFYVARKAGWDTHGLPTEISAEKKLGIKDKKDIEKNVKKFIDECRNNVFIYKKEWEEFTKRIGYWLDLDNAYITCSNDYIESLWWILKKIWDKGLLYEDYKVIPYCPRCGTSLSSHEVAQGYKNVEDPSIYVKFKIKSKDPKFKNTFLLVWTTTPWTLPGNVAVAVNPQFTYSKVKLGGEFLIIADKRLEACEAVGRVSKQFKGKNLIGLEYEPLFDFEYTSQEKNIFKVVGASFVSLEEGTGLVHMAPAFGEEDMAVSKKDKLPVLMPVDEEGKFKKEVKDWAGMFVKKADPLITESLKKRRLIFKDGTYAHEYPFCWRCDTPLLYYAKRGWFINMQKVRKDLIKNNQKINWTPDYLKKGRFGEWLKEVKDWNLSRERYWGTPLPVWECQKCKKQVCIGSIAELKKKAKLSSQIRDLHRPYIDKVAFKCSCGGKMKRVHEVIDCWFDSGSMPYAQWHYPFENKKSIDKKEAFPADFICEGIDQTRGWFYTLLAISTLLGLGPSYKNVISHGIVLDNKGQKMSKSKGNIVKPSDVIDNYGADVARLYFYTLNPVGEPKRFDFGDVQNLSRKFFGTIWNSLAFFSTYLDKQFKPKKEVKPKSLLDKWIISRLESLNAGVIENLDNYHIVRAARLFEEFVDDLSNWYIRRSRKRFQKPESLKEKEEVSQVLNFVLLKLTKLLAPFVPFFAEEIYQQLPNFPKKEQSVHLDNYPEPSKRLINEKLEQKMKIVREVVALALAERATAGIKVRQPLSEMKIKSDVLKKEKELLELVREEVNVKKIGFDNKIGKEVELDLKVTLQLKEEGIVREVIHQIQMMRKKAGYKPRHRVFVRYFGDADLNVVLVKNRKYILKEAKAEKFEIGNRPKLVFDIEREIKIDQRNLWIAIRKM